ncbi:MAG TPA: VCBS repeat-containing protein [Verrucomicrobiae bacterium]|nr:VCBS repeat-containing protein [Verrucomicrobiae bacterium]
MKRPIISSCIPVLVAACLITIFPALIRAQPFVSVNHGLPNAAFGSLAVGDFDGDGDLDVALVGAPSTTQKIGGVYRNNGSGQFQIGPALPAVSPGHVNWGDYDRDGDLDLLVTGREGATGSETVVTRLLRNDNGALNDSGIALPAIEASTSAFCDFDHDGDVDLFIGGFVDQTATTFLLLNEGNQFVRSTLALPGVLRGATVAPADFDADGDVDLLLTPVRLPNGPSQFGSMVLMNKGDGTFETQIPTTDGGVGITGAWHDFDLNGRLDLTIAGDFQWTTAFFDTVFGYWRGSQYSSISEAQTTVGDYDRDGRPDILVMGKAVGANAPATILARNVGMSFSGLELTSGNFGLTPLWLGNVALADLDGDGDLDIIQTGMDSGGQIVTKVYRNDVVGAFAPPGVPDQLGETADGSTATLNWAGPAGATTFNVRIGTTAGGVDVTTPLANVVSGRRRLPALGNAAEAKSFRIKDLAAGKYYWSVQSIDAAFNGSAFAAERSFTVGGAAELRIAIRFGANGNSLVLTLTGIAGRSVLTQWSSDLQNWEDFGATLTSDQEVTLALPSDPSLFYRARVVP